jgi:hypothetical protein
MIYDDLLKMVVFQFATLNDPFGIFKMAKGTLGPIVECHAAVTPQHLDFRGAPSFYSWRG